MVRLSVAFGGVRSRSKSSRTQVSLRIVDAVSRPFERFALALVGLAVPLTSSSPTGALFINHRVGRSFRGNLARRTHAVTTSEDLGLLVVAHQLGLQFFNAFSLRLDLGEVHVDILPRARVSLREALLEKVVTVDHPAIARRMEPSIEVAVGRVLDLKRVVHDFGGGPSPLTKRRHAALPCYLVLLFEHSTGHS